MKRILSAILSLILITGNVSGYAYEFSDNDYIKQDAFDQNDNSLEMWFTWLPMNTSENKTYHDMLKTDFARTFHELITPFNIGVVDENEAQWVLEQHNLSIGLSKVFYLDEIQQTFNATYNTDIDMASLDGLLMEGTHVLVRVIDNYFIVIQTPHGTNANANPKSGMKLGLDSEYWTWYYQDYESTSDYIYTIISYKNVAGYDVRTIDYIGFVPPSDELLNSYDKKSDNISISVTLNDEAIQFDQEPIIVGNRTLVPVRAIFEAMNCGVEWISEKSEINVYQNNNLIMQLHLDSNIMWTEKNPSVELDVPPQIVNDRTLVPVRAISESMGANVTWDEENSRVDILYSSPEFECSTPHKFSKIYDCNGKVYVPKFISTDGNITFRSGNVEVNQVPESISDIGNVYSMAFHKNKLYFLVGPETSNFAVSGIYMCDFNGSNVEKIIDNASNYSTCFIIDNSLYYDAINSKNLDDYYGKEYSGGIYKIDLDSGKSTKIINNDDAKLYHCNEDEIYYRAIENKENKYYSADLNGENVKSESKDSLIFSESHGLSITPDNNMVYNVIGTNISCEDLQGDNRKSISISENAITYFISVTDKYVYYTVNVPNDKNGQYACVYCVEREKIESNIYPNEALNTKTKNALIQYAKHHLSTLYEDDYTGRNTYNDVRFLLADVSGDNEPELLAIGIHDNEMRYLEIYLYENGDIIKILNNYFGYARGGAMNIVWYDGGVRVDYESGSSGTGFLDRLMKYENGDWVDVYNSYIDYDGDNYQIIKGYMLNGEYVSEEEFDAARERVASNPVTLADFVDADALYNQW